MNLRDGYVPVCGMNVNSKIFLSPDRLNPESARGEEPGKFLKEQVCSYHCVGGKGQKEEEKSISLLPSLGQEADGRFDGSAFSRTVTLK